MSHFRDEELSYTRSSPVEDMFVAQRPLRDAAPELRPKFPRGFFLSIVGLMFPAALALSQIGATILYFSDIETTRGDSLTASSLDFTVESVPAPDETALAVLLTVGEGEENGADFSSTVVPEADSVDFSYRIRVEQTGDASAFCNALQVTGTIPLFDYNGSFIGLSTPITGDVAFWPVRLYLPDASGISPGDECMADVIFSGFQEGGEEGQKYHDEERISLIITADLPTLAPLQAGPEFFLLQVPPEEELPPEETVTEDAPLVEEPLPEEPAPEETSETEPVPEPEPEPEPEPSSPTEEVPETPSEP